MPPQGLHRKSLVFCRLVFEKKFEGKNDQTKNEHEQANPVNAVHVFDEGCFGTVGIWLFNVEVFGYLFKYTHKKTAS
jgi:hypothetical protein